MQQITPISLAHLKVSVFNVRKDLDSGQEDSNVEQLAAAIKLQGLLSPLIVRSANGPEYEVIAGQRRLRAGQIIKLDPVPCIVRNDLNDADAEVVSLIENVQRAEMSALDKARILRRLYEQNGAYEAVARDTGLSIATVRRYTSLLDLPESLQKRLNTSEGPRQIVAMSKLAQVFPGDQATEVYDQISGFKGKIQTEIIERSGGDLDKVRHLIEEVKEGVFGDRRCGGRYGCLIVGDIINGEMSEEDFDDLIGVVAENLDDETKRQAIRIAARGFWKALATE